jgi:branched-chain amino acid transport system substrate-binding protein
MTRRHTRWARIPVLVLGLALPGCHAETGPLQVGLAIPLTEAGSVPMRLGAELAAKEINAAGGIAGRRLVLVERDDYDNADSAVAVATALYNSEVVAVVGGAYSSLALAAAPVYNGGRRPLVQLSPSASSPLLTTVGDYTFRLCPSDLAYGAALARYALDRGLRRAAVLYVDDEYGRGVRRTFAAEFSRIGGEVLELDPFLADQPDVGPYLNRIMRDKRAQVLVLAANQAEGLAVLRQLQARRIGLPILAGDGMTGAERTDPALMEGVLVSSAYIVGSTWAGNPRFVQAYRAAFPDAGPPDQGAAASYDGVRLLARVIGEAGTDRQKVRDALARVGNGDPPFTGVVGSVGFDDNGDVPTLGVQIGVARGGVLVPAE